MSIIIFQKLMTFRAIFINVIGKYSIPSSFNRHIPKQTMRKDYHESLIFHNNDIKTS